MRVPTLRASLTAALLAAGPLHAQRMLVRQPSTYLGYGYGNTSWSTFTGLFDGAFGGASNIDLVSAIAPGGLAGYSALMLTLPDLPDAPYTLSASEAATITAFLNGGGRMYVFGENSSWTAWNTSIGNLVGATTGGAYTGNASPAFSGGILQGVSSVYYPAGGAFTSLGATGLSLFDTNVAALFGPSRNSLFILDVNVCDDADIGAADNLQFCRNITGFLNGSVPPVTSTPEPASLALLGLGVVALGIARRRARLG